MGAMSDRTAPRLISMAVIASALAVILMVAACSDEEAKPTASSAGDGAADRLPTVEILAPTSSPILTVTPTPPHTITETLIVTTTAPDAPPTQENARERCNGAANLVPLPESRSEIWSTPDPLELLRQSAVAMSKLESFATTEVVLETFDDRSEDYSRRSPHCDLTQTKYEYPDRATSRRTAFEVRGLSAMSREQNLWIDESAYRREDDGQLWRLLDRNLMLSSESLLPFVMWYLLNEESPSEIQTELRLVGTELLDGVAVYHVQEEVTGRPPEFRNVASFWIGVDDLLLRRAHWAHPSSMNHHHPTLVGFQNELIEFHSFNQDFNIQPPPEDEIAE